MVSLTSDDLAKLAWLTGQITGVGPVTTSISVEEINNPGEVRDNRTLILAAQTSHYACDLDLTLSSDNSVSVACVEAKKALMHESNPPWVQYVTPGAPEPEPVKPPANTIVAFPLQKGDGREWELRKNLTTGQVQIRERSPFGWMTVEDWRDPKPGEVGA